MSSKPARVTQLQREWMKARRSGYHQPLSKLNMTGIGNGYKIDPGPMTLFNHHKCYFTSKKFDPHNLDFPSQLTNTNYIWVLFGGNQSASQALTNVTSSACICWISNGSCEWSAKPYSSQWWTAPEKQGISHGESTPREKMVTYQESIWTV